MDNENNLINIDFNNKLEVKISNIQPVILTDLTLSLLSISTQFQKFIETEANDSYQAGSELFIKEVRSGSIIIELVAQALPVLPLLWSGGSLSEWVNQAKDTIDWLLGKVEHAPKDLTKQDLKQWNSILDPVAKDNGSQMNFTVSDGGKVINQFFINAQEANSAQNAIRRKIGEMEEPEDCIYRKRIMVWYQTKFDDSSHTGDKATIESISKSPLKVIFENNAVKKAMLSGDTRYNKPWHQLAYIVDVKVQSIANQPKVYTIINYHDDDTFDPDE